MTKRLPPERPADDAVGYGRPPKHSQFKKGQSGNPRGRPKGRFSLLTSIERFLNERVSVTLNGQRQVIRRRDLLVTQWINGAMTGNTQARAQLLPYLERLGASQEIDREVSDAIETEIIQAFAQRFKSAKTDEENVV